MFVTYKDDWASRIFLEMICEKAILIANLCNAHWTKCEAKKERKRREGKQFPSGNWINDFSAVLSQLWLCIKNVQSSWMASSVSHLLWIVGRYFCWIIPNLNGKKFILLIGSFNQSETGKHFRRCVATTFHLWHWTILVWLFRREKVSAWMGPHANSLNFHFKLKHFCQNAESCRKKRYTWWCLQQFTCRAMNEKDSSFQNKYKSQLLFIKTLLPLSNIKKARWRALLIFTLRLEFSHFPQDSTSLENVFLSLSLRAFYWCCFFSVFFP